MAALAGFGAGMEVKAPKAPPALFPKFVVEEAGDFPALRSAPSNKELIRLQRTMRAIYKISPYHTKPASQDRDVVRYSDALKRDEEEVLGQLLHTRSRYLPRELRAPPLAVDPLASDSALDSDGFMDIETLLSGVGDMPPLPSFHPIPGMPAELTSHLGSAVPPSPAKRKRPDDDIGNEPKQQTKKKMKKDEKTTKNKSAGKDAGGEENGKTVLDFSNLIKHKLVELRNYCRENGIIVSSRNKQGYVDAIVAWQKKQPKPAAAAAAPKTETARTSAPSDKAAAVAAVAQDKGKEKVGDVPAKAGEAETNGGKLPRPLDRMARLALLEEEGLEEGEEGNQERNKSRLLDEDDEEDENDYNERHDSDAEDDDDDDDDNEPTF